MVTMPPGEAGNVSFRPNPDDPTKPIPYWPKGTVREGPFSVMNCKHGFCDPADAECEKALGWTEAQLAAARHRYQRIVDGIAPEDFEKYDTGVILGYEQVNGQTAYIPGPNWDTWYKAQQEAAKQESDI